MSVYFVRIGDHVKIGHSENPYRRIRRLFSSATRYGAPAGTSTALADRAVLRTTPGDVGDERAIHEALGDFSAGNEWFVAEPAVLDYIASLTPGEYPRLERDGGPYHDTSRDLTPAEAAQLQDAMRGMFAASP